jgi:hypothetical protein
MDAPPKTRHGLAASPERLTDAISPFADSLYATWLFTQSDLKTIVIPKTIFGTLSALAAPSFGFDAITATPTPLMVLYRIPLTLLWVWINLLPFAIDNQRHPRSIAEDAINKPWRVLPSGRMSPIQARNLMIFLWGLAIIVSWRIGGFNQCIMGIALGTITHSITNSCISHISTGFWYNRFGGSDDSCIIRNVINALGYNCFTSGAAEVALGFSLMPYRAVPLSIAALTEPDHKEYILFWKWVAILVAVISTTAHAQDMHDQAGDSIRGR